MTIRVLFFASWRDVIGVPEIDLELPRDATAATALAEILRRWPELEERAAYAALAVNEVFAGLEAELSPGDVLAIVPPVSGGEEEPDRVRISAESIDVGVAVQAAIRPDCGALAIFVGTTRNHHEGKEVLRLAYEAYGPMAEREIRGLISEARQRWPLGAVVIEHRLGEVPVGEASVLIALSSAHRAAGMECCRYLIDRLKEVVPIWKREVYADGSAWVEGEQRRESVDRS